ncbi:XdhC family protein [Streptomyces nanshensis]|uniref:XshC-Cox1 family protein n=1 Tax=Streptomyces nanshensis TaxID=518642 RepID=A0A1E7L9U1_9ACTN|nr:XdhC/CoxI family protein [Streptomyces nanshensis]OEV12924.1 XshC-Cox1 family protein [Streptomyces nanshensis]
MRDIAEGLKSWRAAGVSFALATVTRTWKSAPRQPGASMAVSADGTVLGSISGGCVESAVYELALDVLAEGTPVLRTYGVSDDEALEAGLTCGGVIEVLVRPAGAEPYPELDGVLDDVLAGSPVAVATVIDGPEPQVVTGSRLVVTADTVRGTLGEDDVDGSVTGQTRGLLAQGTTTVVHTACRSGRRMGEVTVFVESFAPPPRMLVFGAIDHAGAVARLGKFLGYHVTVCDARPVFATSERFPDADELVVRWPHQLLDQVTVDESTVICVLTHDPKFDVPLLQRALRTPACYIGAMGSRTTHEDRLRRLREAGVEEAALRRLSSPIGLDLGGRTAEETAVAIMAEVIALKWNGTGRRLAGTDLSIHH